MTISIHEAVGFCFDAFCWFAGLAFVLYSVITTARNSWRQLKRGGVEEGLDIKRAAEMRRLEDMAR